MSSSNNSGSNQVKLPYLISISYPSMTQPSSQSPNNSTNRNNHETPANGSSSATPRPSQPTTTYAQVASAGHTTQPQIHAHIPVGGRSPGGTEVLRRQITTTTRSPGGKVLQETQTIYPPASTPNKPTTPNTSTPASAPAAASTSTYPPNSKFIIYNDTGEMYFDLQDCIGDTLAPGQRITAICHACHGFILEGMVHQCPAANTQSGPGN
jgi:hypothetical protein